MPSSRPPMKERGPQVTPSAVAALAARLGSELPDDYAEFLLAVNGGEPARSHCVFTIRFRNGKANETALGSLNSLDDPDDRNDLVTCWECERAWLPEQVIPVGYDGFGGSVVVVAGPRRGQVWFLDGVQERPEGSNPRVDWFDRRQVAKVADSFREFMSSLKHLDSGAG